MNLRSTLQILGGLLVFLAATLLVPVLASLWYDDGAYPAFLYSAAAAGIVGVALFKTSGDPVDIGLRESFGVVSFGWLLFGVFGGLPYLFAGSLGHPVDAFFESVSGFTTTGSTVINNVEILPKSILLWRSITQWLGGMGIIVLTIAILPFLGVGGMQMFQAEVPGPTSDRLRPRIQDTAKLLWGVYVVITALLVVLLWAGDMPIFDSICHALTTMATGGFSTQNASIGAYDSSYIHWVLTIFMFIAGTNFSLHYYLLAGNYKAYWHNEEFRFYLGFFALSVLIVFVDILTSYQAAGIALRDAAFQVASLVTTTGFATVDYEGWPAVSLLIFMVSMVTGSMAGSTAGGMKLVRVLLAIRFATLQVYASLHPKGVKVIKLDHKPVPVQVIQGVLGFLAIYMGLLLVVTLVVAAMGLDLRSAATATMSAVGNIGPGLGTLGPSETYAAAPISVKTVLSFAMIMGRLELFTVLVLFHPDFWRK